MSEPNLSVRPSGPRELVFAPEDGLCPKCEGKVPLHVYARCDGKVFVGCSNFRHVFPYQGPKSLNDSPQ